MKVTSYNLRLLVILAGATPFYMVAFFMQLHISSPSNCT